MCVSRRVHAFVIDIGSSEVRVIQSRCFIPSFSAQARSQAAQVSEPKEAGHHLLKKGVRSGTANNTSKSQPVKFGVVENLTFSLHDQRCFSQGFIINIQWPGNSNVG
jgi:hypothetical protein